MTFDFVIIHNYRTFPSFEKEKLDNQLFIIMFLFYILKDAILCNLTCFKSFTLYFSNTYITNKSNNY